MTLENATQNLWKAHCNFYDPRKAMNIVVDKIYNDHEVQLKKYIELGEKQALEFDRFFDAFGLKSENISIDDAINFFKAKDKEIEKLKKQYHQCLDDYIKCAERKEQQ